MPGTGSMAKIFTGIVVKSGSASMALASIWQLIPPGSTYQVNLSRQDLPFAEGLDDLLLKRLLRHFRSP
jgi:hypothetical protein